MNVISRDDLENRLQEVYYKAALNNRIPTWNDAVFAIHSTEDATNVRKVTLCKDCKHLEIKENEVNDVLGWCRNHHRFITPYCYCVWAERKEE